MRLYVVNIRDGMEDEWEIFEIFRTLKEAHEYVQEYIKKKTRNIIHEWAGCFRNPKAEGYSIWQQQAEKWFIYEYYNEYSHKWISNYDQIFIEIRNI